MKILFATPECAPYVKTGGLGDVSAALPATLAEMGHDVRVLLPAYRGLKVSGELGDAVELAPEGAFPAAQLLPVRIASGLTLLLLACPSLYQRAGGPYVDGQGRDYQDNALRFGLLARVAALLGTPHTPCKDWQADIVHANDWPTALAPLYLAQTRDFWPNERVAGSVLTIHNIAFQGVFPLGAADLLGIPHAWRGMDGAEFWGQLSMLKAGLQFADAITTVSPSYAREIQTEAFGVGLDGVLRAQPWVGAFRSYQPPQPPVVAQPGGYPAGLVIQAEGDPLDNYEGGVGMAERLGHRLVTVADSGEHEVYVLSGNPVVDELADRYFAEGVLPDGDVSVPGRSARPDIPADPPAAVAPAVKSTTAPVSAAEAFGYFTEAPLEWWPERHKLVSGERVAMVFEPRAGGRWYEVAADGTEARWGTVLEWEPARRIVLTWRIGGDWRPLPDDAGASEIEVGFAPAGDGAGTVVTVAHTRLERYGAAAAGMRAALQAPGPGGTLDAYAAGLQRHLADRAVRV